MFVSNKDNFNFATWKWPLFDHKYELILIFRVTFTLKVWYIKFVDNSHPIKNNFSAVSLFNCSRHLWLFKTDSKFENSMGKSDLFFRRCRVLSDVKKELETTESWYFSRFLSKSMYEHKKTSWNKRSFLLSMYYFFVVFYQKFLFCFVY